MRERGTFDQSLIERSGWFLVALNPIRKLDATGSTLAGKISRRPSLIAT